VLALTSGRPPNTRFRRALAIGDIVQSALSGLAGVGMGVPEALLQLANLCRKCGKQRI
jgi:hypothetical protein